jgi:carnitine 3-dehydrogenase
VRPLRHAYIFVLECVIGFDRNFITDRSAVSTNIASSLRFIIIIFPISEEISFYLDSVGLTATADSIIASSSSGITMSVIQSDCKHPERCVIGHPFNPPHMIPLVEVVGGNKTSPEAIQQAMAFYAAIGKKPINLRKELPGHAANRLQAALYREVVYLIEQGILSVEDADAAVSWGPGLRWGVMGPSLLWHLGGGEGGIRHFMEHLMDPLAAMMKTLGNPELTSELKQTITQGVLREAGDRSVEQLTQEESEMLLGLLRLRAGSGRM